MTSPEFYEGREQTLVKHIILRKYLERFALIVCSKNSPWKSLTYVDCFSGPWNEKSEKFEDSSFAIALGELRKARDILASRGTSVKIRCFFLEKNLASFAKLKGFTDQIKDVEIEVDNASFENSIPKILAFVKKDSKTFPFFFIDPTGWSGFGMQTIAPLLATRPGEVLINLMAHLHRFVDSPKESTQESIRDLFGSLDFKSKIAGLNGLDKQDAVVEAYAENIRITGGFTNTGISIILRPEQDRAHFHLIYATRSRKGIEVFKAAEKMAMAIQVDARTAADLRRKEEETGQQDLLGEESPKDTGFSNLLRDRYSDKSKKLVLGDLKSRGRVPFDDAWSLALSQPMTQESDLKLWIADWKRQGMLEIVGMKPKQKVPQREEGIMLVWTGSKT